MKKLENNNIDLMSAIAYTEKRDILYDYPKNSIITTWGQIFTQPNKEILSILDLDGKVVGVLKNDIYYIGSVGLKKLANNFNVDCNFVELNSYNKILEKIENKELDAGLIPRLYGIKKANKYNVEKCPVVINPIELTVATPENTNLNILRVIDKHLTQLKEEKTSFYYNKLQQWTSIKKEPEMPIILKIALLLIYIIFFLSIMIFYFIRKRVLVKTKQLREKEELLQENKNKITKLHQVAIKMEQFDKAQDVYNLTVNTADKILDFGLCILKIYKHSKLETVASSLSAYNISDYKNKYTFLVEDIGTFEVFLNTGSELNEEEKEITQLLLSHTVSALRRLQAEEKIRYVSFHDRLTGLYNRDYLEEELNRLDSRRQNPLSIIMGDVNGLKLINDTFGHQQGDKLLKNIAKILKDSTRHEDIIGRWGGDEFLIILPKTNKKNALQIVDRINEQCEKTEWDIPVSIALGVAVKNKKYEDVDKIIKEADDLMYLNKIKQGQKNKNKMIESMLIKLKNKNYEYPGHLKRVNLISQKIARKINLNNSKMKSLKLASTLHDIGMLAINDEILEKKSQLTIEEWNKIKTHPEIGYRIASATEKYSEVANVILSHHENWDGSGYPNGIKEKQIPICARIIRIADAFDVMVHKQIYKDKLSLKETITELNKNAGKEFDPQLTEIFIKQVIPEIDFPL